MLIRKGGIHDKDQPFALPCSKAVLFPSFEHQKNDLLKIKPVTSNPSYDEGDRVEIQYWVDFTECLVLEASKVSTAFHQEHIWTEEFVTQKFKWKPERPVFCILCRTYRLPEYSATIYQKKYGGCRSFIELSEAFHFDQSQPVLSDSDYIRKSQSIRSHIVGNKAYIESGCDRDYTV